MAELNDNLDELLQEMDRAAIRTTQGSFVRLDDVKEMVEQRRLQSAVEKTAPKPKTFNEAKRLAKRDEELTKHFPTEPREQQLGRSIPANEPQSSSRT